MPTTTTETTASALNAVELLAKAYAEAREIVAERVNAADDEVRAIYRRKVPGIKQAVAVAAGAQAALIAAIQARPDLFVSPRTLVLAGIKCGYQKGKGRLEWESDEKVIAAIRKSFAPATANRLIITTEKPSKDALAQLPAHELKRIGATVVAAGDFVFVKVSDTAIDKLVAKILDEGAVEQAEGGKA